MSKNDEIKSRTNNQEIIIAAKFKKNEAKIFFTVVRKKFADLNC